MIHTALITRPQREAAAVAWLGRLYGAAAFYPVHRVPDALRSRRAGKTIYRDKRILPGYVFAAFPDMPMLHDLFAGPYVTDAIRVASGHVAVLHPDDLRMIHALRARSVEAETAKAQARMLLPGDTATILAGPLAGQRVEIAEVGKGKVRFRLRLFDSQRLIEADEAIVAKEAAE